MNDGLNEVVRREEIKLTGECRQNEKICGRYCGASGRGDTAATVNEDQCVLLAEMLDFLKQILLGEMEGVDRR